MCIIEIIISFTSGPVEVFPPQAWRRVNPRLPYLQLTTLWTWSSFCQCHRFHGRLRVRNMKHDWQLIPPVGPVLRSTDTATVSPICSHSGKPSGSHREHCAASQLRGCHPSSLIVISSPLLLLSSRLGGCHYGCCLTSVVLISTSFIRWIRNIYRHGHSCEQLWSRLIPMNQCTHRKTLSWWLELDCSWPLSSNTRPRFKGLTLEILLCHFWASNACLFLTSSE